MKQPRRVVAHPVLHDEINLDALIEAVLLMLDERVATQTTAGPDASGVTKVAVDGGTTP